MFLSNLLSSEEPTIFELSMAENLNRAIRPALDYLMATLGERSDTVFRLYKWKDEVFAFLILLIERHYLAVHSASFAENFYALKRMKVDKTSKQLVELCPKDKLTTLMGVVMLPYLRDKLIKFRERVSVSLDKRAALTPEQLEREPPMSRAEVFLKRQLVTLVPFALATQDLASLFVKIAFIFKRTKFYSLLHWWEGVVLTRVTGDDMRKLAEREEQAALRRGFIGKMLSKGLELLKTLLVGSALLFKLVEWYYSPENQSQRENMQGPIVVPPAPLPPKIRSTGIRMPRDPRLCPLCHEPRVNPAISTSGVAFCFTCIHNFTLEHGQCPVTGTPCDPTSIRRLFVN